jgi:hypothetical protein
MVLDADFSPEGQLEGEFCGQVFGVQIIGHDLRLNAKELPIEIKGSLEVVQRFEVLQIADVLADEGVLVPGQAKSVFQLGPAG